MSATHPESETEQPAPSPNGAPDGPDIASPATIRRATPADAASLTLLARAAKASWDYPAAWLGAWEAELSFSPAYLTAELVFAIDAPASDDPFPVTAMCALEWDGTCWHLAHMWVAPGSQGTGLGSQLVRHALAEASQRRPALVLVDADPNAAEFYRRLGGRPAGVRTAPMPGAPDRTLPRFTFGLDD